MAYSFEFMLDRAKCYAPDATPAEQETAAKIASETQCGIWHAWAVMTNTVTQCACAPCSKSRGEPAMCL